MPKRFRVALLVLVVGCVGLLTYSAAKDVEATIAAYLYGYPLVLMDATRTAAAGADETNRLKHRRVFPDHTFRTVVRPNFDTLYSSAWIDLAADPVVISMPATGDRYYVLPFMDAWTNVFARVGTTTTSNGQQEVALVGPDYTREVTAAVSKVIRSPTDMVLMIGRIQTNGPNDVANVAAIQEQMALTPLSLWRKGVRNRGFVADPNKGQAIPSPMVVVENMDANKFFARLNRLMAEQRPLPEDGPIIDKIARLNIGSGKAFDVDEMGPLTRRLVDFSLRLIRSRMNEEIAKDRANAQGWSVIRESIGSYGTDYTMRAGVAKVGLGALPPDEAAYPNCWRTPDGEPLDGSKYRYRLHFDAQDLPPVHAFWSLTVYDDNGYVPGNYLGRFSLGDRSGLTFNDDGSLDIYLQHDRPQSGVSNWMPVPAGPFNITLRLYHPQKSFTRGEWVIPAIQKAPLRFGLPPKLSQ